MSYDQQRAMMNYQPQCHANQMEAWQYTQSIDPKAIDRATLAGLAIPYSFKKITPPEILYNERLAPFLDVVMK